MTAEPFSHINFEQFQGNHVRILAIISHMQHKAGQHASDAFSGKGDGWIECAGCRLASNKCTGQLTVVTSEVTG